MRKETSRSRRLSLLASTAFLAAGALFSKSASAQQRTFALDRLQTPGGPEDGINVFRPMVQPRLLAFGQLAIGYSYNPLHTSNIIASTDSVTKRDSPVGVIRHQLTAYGTVGLQFLNRFTVGATFPLTIVQSGQNPNYADATFGGTPRTAFNTDGAHGNPLRLDLRGMVYRSQNNRFTLGAQASLFAPTGDYGNFGDDGQITGMLMGSVDYDFGLIAFTGNLGVHFRPNNSVNSPNLSNGQVAGLGIGNELRWALGGYIPLADGKIRVGGSIFGQLGIESSDLIGDTFGQKRNTPIEWLAEARFKLGAKERWWIGGNGGSLIANGYGAPDMRLMAVIGVSAPLDPDLDVKPIDAKEQLREKWRRERGMEKGGFRDQDGDGIPDEVDACPKEPEDHEGSEPTDGCPKPPDRDGDGIIDSLDKCPDQAEDKDGIDDGDGCPEDDSDGDQVPDVVDKCPHEPGMPSKDPSKNGCPQFIHMENGKIMIMQQVHFATGKAQILADSFPLLQEIANVLKANPSIKKLAVEGHTDNTGNADKNMSLSQSRADAVKAWLIQHGTEADRLESHGYGQTQPIADNKKPDGRTMNRRCEFKILAQEDTNALH